MVHKIVILTNQPSKKILGQSDVTKRLIGQAIELGEHDMEHRPKTMIKRQVLVDFITKTTVPIKPEGEASMKDIPKWTLFIDESSTEERSGAKIVLIALDKVPLSATIRFNFKVSNNVIEYESLLVGLRLAKELGIKRLKIYSDFQLIVG